MSVALGTLFDVKKTFFDRAAVINATTQADRKALGRIGSYVRGVAKNSIKSVKKETSPPGSPPFSHVGLLKKGILFGYDSRNISVVVGPTLLNGARTKDALEMLEYGGTTTRKGRPARYRARPFMGPAMENSAPFDRFWQDSVK